MAAWSAACLALTLASTVPGSAGWGPAPTAPLQIVAPDGAPGDLFGHSVDVTGDTAVVGASQDSTAAGRLAGSAYVFLRSGDTWVPQAKLMAPDGAPDDFFGWDVAVDADTILVGASGAQAAYVFVRSGGQWTPQAKLTADDDGLSASSVALSGDTAVVSGGAGHVFVRTGGSWALQSRLVPPGGAFAREVAVSGDTALVGDGYADTAGGDQAGSAFVFTRSASAWDLEATLVASDGAADDWFGLAVSLDGDTALAGAYSNDTSAGLGAGSAYVFVRTGGVWAEQARLTASDAGRSDSFGFSVAVEGDRALVGAYFDTTDTGPRTGSVYAFRRIATTWTERAHVVPPDGSLRGAFGWAVALSGPTAVVGAPFHDVMAGSDAGAAYLAWR